MPSAEALLSSVLATAGLTLEDVELVNVGFDLIRPLHGGQIDAVIGAWTSGRSPMDAATALQAAGIPAGPVLDEAAAMSDPQLHERGFFQLLEHPSCGIHFHPGANFHLGATPPRIWRAAPTLGQDNEYVYREVLGYDATEYDALVAGGQVGTRFTDEVLQAHT